MESPRKLATVQRVVEIIPIEDADKIEIARIGGWQCVVKKGELKQGELCFYAEIDSLLPVTNLAFQFLGTRSKPKKVDVDGKTYEGYRLKTIKLKGTLSQGLALPIASVFPKDFTFTAEEGQELSEMLGIVKYERPLPSCLAGKVKGTRPGFIPKTDEERVQNLGYLIEKHQGNIFYITEKLDGSSATYYKKDGVFGVCSRNMELLDSPENSFWKMAHFYNLPEDLPDGYVFQGELVGPGIQGNPLKLSDIDVYFYNVLRLSDNVYLNFEEFYTMVTNLGLKTVPIISPCFILHTNTDGLLKMADGKSMISPDCDREGIVLRPLLEGYETIGGTLQRFSFKAISNNYLLSHDE